MTRSSRVHDIEPWFLRNGLPYFVEQERSRARAAVRPTTLAPLGVLVALAAVGAAGGLTWLTRSVDEGVNVSVAPATLTAVLLSTAALYFVTALRARPIVTWALRRTVRSARQLMPMVTRALPLLLLFVTFLFINAEVWQLSAQLDGAVLWLTILLFAAMAVLFLLVRLPEEVDRVDDDIDTGLLLRATRGTPIQDETARLVERDPALALGRYADVPGWERKNLILVLLITQVAQVLLLSLCVFVFFLVFGGLVMERVVQESWTGETITALPHLDTLSVELVQVSVFLAGFSGLYFTVGVVTDDTYREQFFSEVLGELERAVGVRAAYLALRDATADDAAPADAVVDVAGEPTVDEPAGEDDPEDGPEDATVASAVPAPLAPPPPPPPGSPDELVAHWGFSQGRTDEISAGVVTGELVLMGDGRLFRRHGGPSHVHGSTRWDFGPWHPFTGWQPVADEGRARAQLARRGYVLTQPGPLTPQQRNGGPWEGPPPPAVALDDEADPA